jgi:hypothetical protein
MEKPLCSTSNKPKKKTPARPRLHFNQAPEEQSGFVGLLLELISWEKLNRLTARKNQAGRPTYKLSRAQLLLLVLFHYTVRSAGTLAEHLLMLAGIKMSEGTLSERRQALPFEVFEELLQLVLGPRACAAEHNLYRGLNLVALDGVTFSVCNHEAVNQQLRKGKKKSESAFAQLRCAVLLELSLHNPLAAVLGRQGQSEWNLAQQLCPHLPAKSLLLADRLYGCGAFIGEAWKVLEKNEGHFLIRVKVGAKVHRVVQRLEDGSALVEIKVMDPTHRHRIAQTLVVREIRATLRRKGKPPVRVRFWTSLLDPKTAPAHELVGLYAHRWEEELYFRELKQGLGINDLLQSQTVDTAAQEVAAMIVASALIASERSKLSPGEDLTHRISFIKVWDLLEPLWLTLLLGGDLLSPIQKQQIVDRFYWMASQMKMGKKRARSCPRVVRQRSQRWPKKGDQKSISGPVTIRVTRANPAITERN